MAFVGKNVTVTTTAGIVITGADTAGEDTTDAKGVLIKNTHASITIYIGGSDVDSTHGYPVLAGEALPLGGVGAGDLLYAVAASSTVVVAILEVT